MFSAETLTEDQALELAEAYFKGEKDPLKMALLLGVDRFDLNILMHPLVRRQIVRIQKSMGVVYSLKDHVAKLQEIRDSAIDDENWKVALSAETQVGKAAGLYEPKIPGDEPADGRQIDAKKLTTEELKRRIAQEIGAFVPNESPIPTSTPRLLEHDDDFGEDSSQI